LKCVAQYKGDLGRHQFLLFEDEELIAPCALKSRYEGTRITFVVTLDLIVKLIPMLFGPIYLLPY
jgi:hypothetical protein